MAVRNFVGNIAAAPRGKLAAMRWLVENLAAEKLRDQSVRSILPPLCSHDPEATRRQAQSALSDAVYLSDACRRAGVMRLMP
jgi:hypothetical protein